MISSGQIRVLLVTSESMCSAWISALLLVFFGLVCFCAALGPSILFGTERGRTYHNGTCIVQSHTIVHLTDDNCYLPYVNVLAHDPLSSDNVWFNIYDAICYKTYNDGDNSALFMYHGSGSSASCWWWVSGSGNDFNAGGDFGILVIDPHYDYLVPMCIFLALGGVQWIAAILIFIGLCCDECCDCGCGEMCYNFDWFCCDRIDRYRYDKRNREYLARQRVCGKCRAQYMTDKARNSDQLCDRCTTVITGVNEFLNGQGTELQNFVGQSVLELVVQSQ